MAQGSAAKRPRVCDVEVEQKKPAPYWDWQIPVATILQMDPFSRAVLHEMNLNRAALAIRKILIKPRLPNGDAAHDLAGCESLRVWDLELPGKGALAPAVFPAVVTFDNSQLQNGAAPRIKFIPRLVHVQSFLTGAFYPYTKSNEKVDQVVIIESTPGGRTIRYAMDWFTAPTRFTQFLEMVQHTMANPCMDDPANVDYYTMCKKESRAYDAKVLQQVADFRPDPVLGLAGRPGILRQAEATDAA